MKKAVHFYFFLLLLYTVCLQAYREAKSISQNCFKTTAEPEKITSPFCQCHFWKRGPYPPRCTIFFPPVSCEKQTIITIRFSPSLSPSQSPTHSPAERHRGTKDRERGGERKKKKEDSVEKLIDKHTHTQSYCIQWAQRASTIKHTSKAYLCYVCLLINGHKDFVEKRFKVIALDAVHDKAFQRGHWETQTVTNNCANISTVCLFFTLFYFAINCFHYLFFLNTVCICNDTTEHGFRSVHYP